MIMFTNSIWPGPHGLISQKFPESLLCRFPVKSDQRPDEQPQALALFTGSANIERGVVFVEPMNRQLQSAPRVKTRAARVGVYA
jgi:hypothetical protein